MTVFKGNYTVSLLVDSLLPPQTVIAVGRQFNAWIIVTWRVITLSQKSAVFCNYSEFYRLIS